MQSDDKPTQPVEVSVVLPCLNEAETLETCVLKALACLEQLGVAGEVVVSDNGSTDGSQELATAAGARVVHAPIRGYGGALMAGIDAARGRYVIMADSDDSYDLAHLGPFIDKLREGYDVVMGNRFKGGIEPGAMPFLHKYLGNPVLSLIGRVLFKLDVGDFHCGIRGFDRQRILDLDLCMPGMEFASELVVRASLSGYRIAEVPTTLRPDGRSRPPHLRTWRDGWRHLRFLLVLAPQWTLVAPGLVLLLLGAVGTLALMSGPVTFGSLGLDVNALVYSCIAVIVGAQLLLFGGFANVYGRVERIVPDRRLAAWSRFLRLEVCAAVGLALTVIGLLGTGLAISAWAGHDFGAQNARDALRVVIPSATLIATGILVVFSGLFASLMTLRVVHPHESAVETAAADALVEL